MTQYYKGYAISLTHDLDADNPVDWTTPEERGAWFVLQHPRYNVPCELTVDFDRYESWTELAADVSNGRPYKFVRWYEHSGIAVSLRDAETGASDWDAGIAGVMIGESVGAIQLAFGSWAAYIQGEVYTLTVTAPDGVEVDRLVGLYGYDEALACAHWVIDADARLTGVERIRRHGRARAPRARELHA